MKVDLFQIFISSAGIIGIGLRWFAFTKKAVRTVRALVEAPFISAEPDDDESAVSQETD